MLVVPTTALMVLVCICACRCKTVFACFSFFLIIITFHAPLPLHYFHIPTMFSRVLKMLYYYHFSCYEASELEVNENFIIVGKDFREIKSNDGRKNYFLCCKTLHCLIIFKYFLRALFSPQIIDFYQYTSLFGISLYSLCMHASLF